MKHISKKILLVILLNGFICYSQNKNEKTNKIKSYSETSYDAEDIKGKIEKTKKHEEKKVYNYNEKEQLVKYELFFSHNGKPAVTSELYSYNEKGKLYLTKKMKGKDTNVYNDKGLLIEETKQYSTGKFKSKGTYKYDEMGNNIEYSSLNKDDSLNDKILTAYDKKRNKIEILFYGADNKLINKFTYKNDRRGNKIESLYYNADKELQSKNISKYDKKDNEIETLYYNANNKLKSRNTYKYDKKGNEIEQISYYPDDNDKMVKDDIIKHSYDKKGNLILYTKKGEYEDSHKTYSYTYDKMGNWTQQIISINNAVFFIKERNYKYY